jgi:hypothetical protein
MTARHTLSSVQWEDIKAAHPESYGHPDREDNGIHDAALYLAHATPDDPEGESAWEHDGGEHGSYTRRRVPVSLIAKTDVSGSHRVDQAREGYRSGAAVPPVILTARNGQYEIADGHHRTAAARQVGLKTLDAYVMRSPHRTPLPPREY